MTRRGFPHSDIPGSQLVCSSPRLIAAYRVLHRLLAPRHSPYALSSLTIGMELTLPDIPENARMHQPLFPTPFVHEHCCVCGSEKTTVCRIFSCQRSSGGNYRPAELIGCHGALSPGPPWLESSYNLNPKTCLADSPSRVSFEPRARRPDPASRLVENTGLEPVTSWLQTRRSPS